MSAQFRQPAIFNVVSTALQNFYRPSYLRSLAQATLDWRQNNTRQPVVAIPLQNLVHAAEDIHISISPTVFGDTSMYDVLALCTLIRSRKPRTIFEFGTFRGYTTVQMAMNVTSETQIFTLDVAPEQRASLNGADWEQSIQDEVIGEIYITSPYKDQITQLLEDSRTFNPSPYEGQMDFIFVDACHEYAYVRNDSEKALHMLSEDGILAWHDYSRAHPGVCKYLDHLAKTREVFRVQNSHVAFCYGSHSGKT